MENVKFLINTVHKVENPGYASTDSSSGSDDEQFPDEYREFRTKRKCPFNVYPPPIKSTEGTKRQRITNVTFLELDFDERNNLRISEYDCSHNTRNTENVELESLQRLRPTTEPNNTAMSFLKKISEEAFAPRDKHLLSDKIAVVVAYNRMLSLSSGRNKLMLSVLADDEEKQSPGDVNVFGYRSDKFGFLWTCDWYDHREGKRERLVPFETVRKFYKYMKGRDADAARAFLAAVEDETPVPYQEIREYAKNHAKTRRLHESLVSDGGDCEVYLSLIDSDVVNFNHVFSAYLEIVENSLRDHQALPTVMTTGYEYPEDVEYSMVFKIGSNVDRMVRVITARLLPLSVYYPEPNLCLLIPSGEDTIPESFVNRKRCKLESANVINQICNSNRGGNKSAITGDSVYAFSDLAPLVTAIPDRAKLNKSRKSPISFSAEFKNGASPLKTDVGKLKQISQSHFHAKVWYDNLFVNGAIRITGCTQQHAKHLLAQIRNAPDAQSGDIHIAELKQHIHPTVVDNILAAMREIREFVETTEVEYIRSENEQELLDVLETLNIKEYEREKLLILSQDGVLQQIPEEMLPTLLGEDVSLLETMFYNDDIIDSLPDIQEILDRGEYELSEIIERFEEDPRHLEFMKDHPTHVVYQNHSDEELIDFGLLHYGDEIDLHDVREMLCKYPGEMSAAGMEFEMIMMNLFGEEEDEYCSDFDFNEEEEGCLVY